MKSAVRPLDHLTRIRLPANGDNPFEIPQILFLVYKTRGIEFAQGMPLDTAKGRALFLYWWIAFGRKEYNFQSHFVSEKNRTAFSASVGMTFDGFGWTYLAEAAHTFEAWTEPTSLRRPEIGNNEAAIHWFYFSCVPARGLGFVLTEKQRDWILLPAAPPEPSFKPSAVQMTPGVNVVGLSGSVSGVGQDARMAAASLEAARVPFSVTSLRGERAASAAEGAPPSKMSVNLFCLTGFQLMLGVATQGNDLFEGSYNIGFFPWELPEWPKDLGAALEICDEFWCASEFIQQAIQPLTEKPVLVMPMAVELETPYPLGRDHFGLNEKDVVFNFIFDFTSGAERKNIWACIEAFQKAFPKENGEPVRLVIKTINHHPSMASFQRLEREVNRDDRLVHLQGSMSRGEILSLMNCSDVFLSLHRAEGFGRCLAESMLLGKHVVATHYSGNLVFGRSENTYFVDYALVPVQADEYIFSHDQVWADADISSAVTQIRRCFSDIRAGRAFNRAGQNLMVEIYSKEAVGRMYRDRLVKLNLID